MQVVPKDWMSSVKMDRIVVHWTGGSYQASNFDKTHYHILIEGDPVKVVRGGPSIADNTAEGVKAKKYAAHTLNCNTRAIGVSVCAMGGKDVTENPFVPGKFPLKKEQWDLLIPALAELCIAYKITVTPKTLLTHAEVESNLGIKQKGKWDITRLAFDPSIKGAKAVGDKMRAEVSAAVKKIQEPVKPVPVVDAFTVQPTLAIPGKSETTTTTISPAAEKLGWWQRLLSMFA